MLLLCKKPELKCDVSPNTTPRDGNCLLHGNNIFQLVIGLFSLYFLAISDGILQNDALKHNGEETLNETWTNLLEDLKFFGNEDNHMMYLRRRFVLGASEFMSGAHGSKQNDKELFEYTDNDWE